MNAVGIEGAQEYPTASRTTSRLRRGLRSGATSEAGS